MKEVFQMKKSFKKLNKKGFSMVELIIVIAIMAVLVAVLAPTYIQYVQRSRQTNDMNTASAIEQAINTLIADGTITGTVTVTWNTDGESPGLVGTDAAAVITAIEVITGEIGAAQSNRVQGLHTCAFTVTFTDGMPAVSVLDSASAYYDTWDD